MSAHEQKPKPLLFEDTVVVVPVRDEAQRAFEKWFRRPENLDALAEVMAPFGLDPRKNLAMPTIERVVREGEGRKL